MRARAINHACHLRSSEITGNWSIIEQRYLLPLSYPFTMSPVALIFGAGPGVGHHVSQAFRGKGYKVGIASRSLNPAPHLSPHHHPNPKTSRQTGPTHSLTTSPPFASPFFLPWSFPPLRVSECGGSRFMAHQKPLLPPRRHFHS